MEAVRNLPPEELEALKLSAKRNHEQQQAAEQARQQEIDAEAIRLQEARAREAQVCTYMLLHFWSSYHAHVHGRWQARLHLKLGMYLHRTRSGTRTRRVVVGRKPYTLGSMVVLWSLASGTGGQGCGRGAREDGKDGDGGSVHFNRRDPHRF